MPKKEMKEGKPLGVDENGGEGDAYYHEAKIFYLKILK